jgi:hypothetical protein
MTALVTCRRACFLEEARAHYEYLKAYSHRPRPAQLLEQGWHLEKGQVNGVADIGRLPTCFGNLGAAYSKVLYLNVRRFRQATER